jgi:hypothetical protein
VLTGGLLQRAGSTTVHEHLLRLKVEGSTIASMILRRLDKHRKVLRAWSPDPEI